MKKKKAVLSILSIILIVAVAFSSFFFSRKSVAFYVGSLDPSYISNLEKPEFLNSTYRTKIVTDPADNYLNTADLIIDHSVLGLENFESYRVEYDPLSLIEPYVNQIPAGTTYLYKERDEISLEVLALLEENVEGLVAVPYTNSIERAMYGIYSERIGSGLILTINLDETIGFIRTLNDQPIAVTYIDAAALETITPSLVFSPDWDSIIRERLVKGNEEI